MTETTEATTPEKTEATTQARPAIGTLSMLNLDCADPSALAAFYARVLGWEVTYDDGEHAAMISDGSAQIGFGRVEGYTAPAWDDTAVKRYHLDLRVADLDAAQAALTELGAATADPQPDDSGERWRVMLDPAGHPFCICPTPQP